MSSGFSRATCSISTPPRAEAMNATDFVRAIDEHRQIQLLGDVGRFADQHAVHRQRAAAGLIRLHLRAEHLRRGGFRFVRRLHQLHAAGLAAAAGVDLRLDHPLRRRRARCAASAGLLGRRRDFAGRHGNAVVGKQLLGLVFVEIHACTAGECWRGTTNRRGDSNAGTDSLKNRRGN